MTLKQMDDTIQSYCELIAEGDAELCADCRIKHLCDKCNGEFDKYPDILTQAYAIVGVTPDNWCCDGCIHDSNELDEYPCTKCKANTVHSDPNYDVTPWLWTPANKQVPVIETEMVTGSTPNENNPVTHPSHYTQGNIECIDAMVSAFGKEATANFCHLNAFKYLWRTEHKNGLQDIDKAIWYLNKYKELKSCG